MELITRNELFDLYEELQRYIGWEPEDRALVYESCKFVRPSFPSLIEDFYAEIHRHPNAVAVIKGGDEQIHRLKKTLTTWIEQLFTCDYDQDYVASRWRVGGRHVEIGLDQTFAMAALARLRIGIVDALRSNWEGDPNKLDRMIRAICKLLDLEGTIINSAYQAHFAQRLHAQAEDQIKQSERLAAIGQMITGLAHESRNVLQRSYACLEALMLDIDDMPDAFKQAKRIQMSLDNLQMLYEEVRNYAAPINLDLVKFDLVMMIKTVWQNLQFGWQEKSIRFSIVKTSEGSCIVNADRYRIEQVFTNLLQNAVDACPAEGSIDCQLRHDGTRNRIRATIIDSGPGIEPKSLNRIFEPFFTTKTKGTGLGLAIAQRIVQAHHGHLSAYNTDDNGGAAFEIDLPYCYLS